MMEAYLSNFDFFWHNGGVVPWKSGSFFWSLQALSASLQSHNVKSLITIGQDAMSTNSIIFTALACFALLLFIVAVSIARGRNRIELDQSSEDFSHDQIYVGNLPYHLGENDLYDYFSSFGAIETIKIVRNFRTGRSKGYAFVTYANAKQAVKALGAHGKDLKGRSLVVRIAKSREQHAYT